MTDAIKNNATQCTRWERELAKMILRSDAKFCRKAFDLTVGERIGELICLINETPKNWRQVAIGELISAG